MNIIITYNKVTKTLGGAPEDLIADEDSILTVNALKETLLNLGHKVRLFDVNIKSLSKLSQLKPDLFFNQAFGIGDIPDTESKVAKLLENTKIPFTGSPSAAIELSNSKIDTKKLLSQHDIATPKIVSTVTGEGKKIEQLHFPAIVKLSAYHSSIGLSQKSIVNSPEETADRISQLSKTYRGPFVVEEYIEGRELNVCLLGNGKTLQVLPISEILFSDYYKDKYKIVDFAAKWLEKSDEYLATSDSRCPAPMDEATLFKVESIAKKAFDLVGCADYARVDVRLTSENEPFVLEVNANCAIGPNDGAIRSAKAQGMTYGQFVQKIVDVALERYV